MKRKLSENNVKELKYALRAGFVVGFLITIFAPLISILISDSIDRDQIYLFIISGLSLGLIVMWLINRKYWKDLRNNQKEIIIKTVSKKNFVVSYEAGSSVGFSFSGKKSIHYLDQKGHNIYSLIIDQYKYKVKKDLYDLVDIGDKIEMHYAPFSKYPLGIEKIKNDKL